jgi:VanZ family protein
MRPETGHVFLERFLAFAALGTTFGVGYPRRMPFAVAATVLAAIGLETAQLLIPGRHARVIDAGEKIAGGVAGLAMAAVFLALSSRAGTRGPA